MKKVNLFRGQAITGEWIFGDLIHVDDRSYIFSHNSTDSYDRYEVLPESVGQFTGITDKDEVKIFNGDVLQITGKYKPGRYVVVWDEYRLAWWGKNIKVRENEYDDNFYQLLDDSFQAERRKVIGNIHHKIMSRG